MLHIAYRMLQRWLLSLTMNVQRFKNQSINLNKVDLFAFYVTRRVTEWHDRFHGNKVSRKSSERTLIYTYIPRDEISRSEWEVGLASRHQWSRARLRIYICETIVKFFNLSCAFESLFDWSGSFYFEIDTGDCWPKTNVSRRGQSKDEPRGLLKLVFLVWTRERKWERSGAGRIGRLQWNRCRFYGLENEYVELVVDLRSP